jgi:hypothetical protein
MIPRSVVLSLCLAAAAQAAPAAQTGRIALEAVASTDATVGSTVPRFTGIWFDLFAALRVTEGLDVVFRPVVSRRTFDGTWQKQIYQLGVRYERPGRVGLRVEGGHLPSPIGFALLENRPDLNPVVSQHSAYYLPLPRVDPETIPRTFLIAAAYPLGAQVTVSGRGWDARGAVVDSSPIRGRPFFGSTKPPRMTNTVVGVGVKPHIGLRIGASVGRGAYVAQSELAGPAASDRDATVVQLEAEWSFGYTRVAGELLRSSLETARSDAVAAGGWVEITQTLTPRLFIAGRADSQRFRYERVSGVREQQRYHRFEAIAGVRVSRDLTLRGGYMVRTGYVVSHWDDQIVLSAVWQRKIL